MQIGIAIDAADMLLSALTIFLEKYNGILISEVSVLFSFHQVVNEINSYFIYITGILFLVWLHRAYSNLTPLQSQNQPYTPGWAVGCWFIPIANMYLPYKVVKKLWIESDPLVREECEYWHRSNVSALFGYWWALWLLSGVIGLIYTLFALIVQETITSQTIAKIVMLTSLFNIGAAYLCIKIVSGINKRQEARSINLNLAGNATPTAPPVFHQTSPS